MSIPRLTRRSVLVGCTVTAASTVAGYLLARASAIGDVRSAAAAANDYGPAPQPEGNQRLALVDDVPDGGGLVLTGAAIVLTRDGSAIRGFSATCTHQGCPVDSVSRGVISCPCHGSQFDARTGSARSGPAERALPEVAVVVRDGAIFRA